MTKIPPMTTGFLSCVSGDRGRDRRRCIQTPIRVKLRPARSARRALRSYLTAVTFRQHFPAPHKIIRLLNKRGFSFRWLRQVSRWLRRCSGDSRCRKVVCRCGKGWVSHPIREYGGEIFTDYYFGEANTANRSDKLHNSAKSENLNWGGFPGCYIKLDKMRH